MDEKYSEMFNEFGAKQRERERETETERERENKSTPANFINKIQYFPLKGSNKYRAITVTVSSKGWERWERVAAAQTWKKKNSENVAPSRSYKNKSELVKDNVET